MAGLPEKYPEFHVDEVTSRGTDSRRKRKSGSEFTTGVLAITLLCALSVGWFTWTDFKSSLPERFSKQESKPDTAKQKKVSGETQAALVATANDSNSLPESEVFDLSPLPKRKPFTSEQSVVAQNEIDGFVFDNLKELNIEPAKLCSDEVFLRRVYIDTLGTLPTMQEAMRFLDDADPQKRALLIDEVLERPEFADYLAMKWCDILRVKAEFPIKMWPNAAQAFHRWIRTSIDNNMPYDEFVREMLTSSGSNFRKPQANFFRSAQSQDPKVLAHTVALSFMCQRTDAWPAEKLEEMSLFFSQIGFKPTVEWKEEIVFFDRRKGNESESEVLHATFPDGSSIIIPAGQDPREVFADWLLHENTPLLSRALANRVWFWLLGHGIVDPVDDFRPEHPPSNPSLLQYLSEQLITTNYDVKHLYRVILNSHTYQLACIPSSKDPLAAEHFAFYPVRRLDAEVLIDAICQISGVPESYSSIIPEPFTFLPDGQRAVSLPDGSITSSFLEMFGRPSRDTGLESDRNNRLTAAQSLHLLNSNHLRNKLKDGPGIENIVRESWSSMDSDPSEAIFLAILSRRPTDDETSVVGDLCVNSGGAREVAWALINSDEFLFRH